MHNLVYLLAGILFGHLIASMLGLNPNGVGTIFDLVFASVGFSAGYTYGRGGK